MSITSNYAVEDVSLGFSKTPETPFLMDLFKTFNESNINYCVERNYEGLPYDLRDHDLDILVQQGSIARVIDIISVVSDRNHGSLVNLINRSDGLKEVICIGETQTREPWGVRIDLSETVSWRGLKLDDLEAMLPSSIYYNTVCAQDPDRSAISAFLVSVFYGNHYSRNGYDLRAMAAYRQSPDRVKEFTTGKFGRHGEVIVEILKNGNFHRIRKAVAKLKLYMLLKRLSESPVQVLRNNIQNVLICCSRFLNRPGILMAVLGLDGSGKSTIVSMIRRDMERLLHTDCEHYHFRPCLFPPLAELLGRGNEKNNPVINPHAKPANSSFISFMRLVYYALDYILGFWFMLYPKLLRNPTILIFDRYFYDFFFDAERYRINLPKWIIRFVCFFVPRPDLVCVIKPNPEVFYQRKPELPLKELQEQEDKLEKLVKSMNHVVWINTSVDIETSFRELRQAVLEFMLKVANNTFHNGK